jgi:hypothetical protein
MLYVDTHIVPPSSELCHCNSVRAEMLFISVFAIALVALARLLQLRSQLHTVVARIVANGGRCSACGQTRLCLCKSSEQGILPQRAPQTSTKPALIAM